MKDRADPAEPLMSERRVSLLGAMFVAIGPVSMALYTPAMTEIVHAFGTTEGMVKLSLTLYFGGFACAQLIAGPLSDAMGRRPVTFGFMAIYFVASLVAYLAPDIQTLLGARFVQGIGASAGVAMSRAIVRDLFSGEKSSRIMNLIGIILAVGPAFAPTIGGLMLGISGWRSIFALMALFGVIVVAVTAVFLRETVVADPRRLRPGALVGSYVMLLGNRHFMTATLAVAGAIGALYAQATFLPFILMERVGLSATQFGVGMLLQSGSFFLGSVVVRQAMRAVGAYRLVGVGMTFIAIGAAGVSLLLFWEPSFLRVMGPVAIYSFGIAFVMPAMTTAALAPFPAIAGAASSMMGFMQMGSGLVVGSIGAAFGNPVLAMATLIPMMGTIACISWLMYRSRPYLDEPEPRYDVIVAPQPGRTLMRDAEDRDR